MKKRIDRLLVEWGAAESREKAQRLIAENAIVLKFKGKTVKPLKPSEMYDFDQPPEVEIKANEILRFVSRGGLKLEGALLETGVSVEQKSALDIGQSTGGFTDCLLKAGARQVTGVDVGSGQLHPKLRADQRVKILEKSHILHTRAQELLALNGGGRFDVVVIDLSFISLTKVLPVILEFLGPEGELLALVKPQFEVGPENLSKGGIVKDSKKFEDVKKSITEACTSCGLSVKDYFKSRIEGGDGNQEFFLWARPDSAHSSA